MHEVASAPEHFDRQGKAKTRLLERLHTAQSTNVFKPKQAKAIVAMLDSMSMKHATHLANVRSEIEKELLINVSATAGANLLHFLEERAGRNFVSARLGLV